MPKTASPGKIWKETRKFEPGAFGLRLGRAKRLLGSYSIEPQGETAKGAAFAVYGGEKPYEPRPVSANGLFAMDLPTDAPPARQGLLAGLGRSGRRGDARMVAKDDGLGDLDEGKAGGLAKALHDGLVEQIPDLHRRLRLPEE